VGGIGTVLFVLLRLAFDRTDPVSEILEPLGAAIAAGAVGSLVWAYHRTVSAGRSGTTLQAAKLVTSGVGLAAAATGIGIVVNSALSIAATPLAGDGIRTLLLGGISAVAVGGPLWWLTWKPGVAPEPTELGRRGRRVYLIAVFCMSAIVADITLLVIGYRVFESCSTTSAGAAWWTAPVHRSACWWRRDSLPDTTSRSGVTTVPSLRLPRPGSVRSGN
jgi:hypothetical protein